MIKTHVSWSTRELLNISQAHLMLLEPIDKIPWTWSISLLKSSCIFLLLLLLSCSVMSGSLWPHGLQPARFFYPWQGYQSGFSTSFSRGSSWPKHWTCDSCIGRQILYCQGPAWGTPPMAKVMRKEAWHTQRCDQASGDPLFLSI